MKTLIISSILILCGLLARADELVEQTFKGTRIVNGQSAAAPFEFHHPVWNFDTLIDALSGPIELAVPIDRLCARAIRGGHAEID